MRRNQDQRERAGQKLYAMHMAEHGSPATGWDQLDDHARAEYRRRAARQAVR